jgi:hypothetical protein
VKLGALATDQRHLSTGTREAIEEWAKANSHRWLSVEILDETGCRFRGERMVLDADGRPLVRGGQLVTEVAEATSPVPFPSAALRPLSDEEAP